MLTLIPIFFRNRYGYSISAADTFNMRIVVDDAPANWYFNYCDEEGIAIRVVFLCLKPEFWTGERFSSQSNSRFYRFCLFHFELTSPNLGTYNIPFICHTNDPIQDDIIRFLL